MTPTPGSPDAVFAAIAQAGNEVTQGWMRLMAQTPAAGAGAPWLEEFTRDTARWSALQSAYLEKQSQLWTALLTRQPGPIAAPETGDRRFAAAEWRDNPYYDYVKQSYLLASRFMEELVEGAKLDDSQRTRARFALKQWLDAMCPVNFAATNPQVLREALDTRGESLTKGLANLLGDARKGRISQTDESTFEVGRNLAVTPGAVVFQNELIQLIQYNATTPQVGKRPLVMVPPCINKYYILDLQPESSFVRYAVEQGHTVFMVSWRNVGPEQGAFTWDDYLEKGVFEAFRVAREIAKSDRVNALGFCVGGTLLGAALAVMAEKGEDTVASATWLTTLLDFSEPGQLGLFVDEAGVLARESTIGARGVLSGSDLAFVFSSLRANDLVWPYVVNNYLLGGTPAAFDLLYWNSDSTNLPGPMYCYYLRNTYLENKLREPGGLVNCGVPVDLAKVKVPSFVLATREDHIVPWRAAYRSLGLLGGEKTFVLGASGHVAGVVNPASKGKRSYWSGTPYPADPEQWLAAAQEKKGSWWTVWSGWLGNFKGGERVAPKVPGNARHKTVEPAPGSYVMQRAN